jgi:hypothetical protein
MRYGLLSIIKIIRYGYGLQKTPIQRKSSDSMPETVTAKGRRDCGIPCPVFTGNVPYVILISGLPMKEFFRRSGIVRQEKKAEKQTISGVSTAQ